MKSLACSGTDIPKSGIAATMPIAVRESTFAIIFVSCLICMPRRDRHPLFADAIGPLRQHVDAIETFARRDVKHALVGAGEPRIGRLTRHLDRAEMLAGGVEHLNAGNGRDIEPILAIERHAVSAALLAFGDIEQSY